MDNFIPSENLKRFNPLEPGVDEFTRSTLLKLLLHEAEKSCLTRQQLDRIDRHMGHNAERALKLLATLNDLMANYHTIRQRIGPAG